MPVNYDTDQFNVTASADLTRDTEEVTLIISDNSDGSYCAVAYAEDESKGTWSVIGRTYATRREASERFDSWLDVHRKFGYVFAIPTNIDGD